MKSSEKTINTMPDNDELREGMKEVRAAINRLRDCEGAIKPYVDVALTLLANVVEASLRDSSGGEGKADVCSDCGKPKPSGAMDWFVAALRSPRVWLCPDCMNRPAKPTAPASDEVEAVSEAIQDATMRTPPGRPVGIIARAAIEALDKCRSRQPAREESK